ncbi:hypothetical protein EVAR_8825_1 [Eumeta japonica]|uniref:Uncharacterized protein n=1 Tax=Eumeta variegata TaxID=151549 RepID=A0A4C1TTZ4_EUMVA|nr:hypothetical protein EVAR_8825_1 [Eumeta japonica]
MSEVPVKKKHQSGSEKRKKRQEQQNKLNEQLKKTQNLFKLGFSCESKEHQLHDSLSTSFASHTMAADPVEVPCEPFEQIGQDQETPTLVGAEESEAETEVIHQNVVHLGRELFDDYETKANEKTDTQYSDENQRVRKGKDITMTELQKKLCSEEKRVKS